MSSAGASKAGASNDGRVAIVGGGLAGLAAAAALAEQGIGVDIYEARRRLAGRAGSFFDSASGLWIDHCQHVSLGCCTNLAAFCRRTGINQRFRRDRVITYFLPDGRRFTLAGSRWLPAPLHLGPAFLRLGFLSWRERLGVARALLALSRWHPTQDEPEPTVGQWLAEHHQSAQAIERFWAPVLVSALGETLDRAALGPARKVFVDGFMSNARGYELEVPRVPLAELYGPPLVAWLETHGAQVFLESPIERIRGSRERIDSIVLASGRQVRPAAVVLAVPWRRARGLLQPGPLTAALRSLADAEQLAASPITGVHLWFDRELTDLPHAVLLDTTSQWLFNHGFGAADEGYYYQVVISASRELASLDRQRFIDTIVGELAAVFPPARSARLLNWRMVSEQSAVFSAAPGADRLRPPQRTSIPNLALAGDWTQTGWPSTMEGAVRSGHLAAEALLDHFGQPTQLLVPDLRRGWLARLLLGREVDRPGRSS